MQRPEVSVIIASYNVGDYIARAVETALAQDALSLEVLVADDASRDHTRQVLANITDPRLRCLYSDENRGAGAARNRAIAAAQGEWIVILDGDDALNPGRIQRLVAMAKDQKADIVVDNLWMVAEDSEAGHPMFAPAALAAMPVLDAQAFIAGNQRFTSGYGFGYFKPVFRAEFLRQHRLRYPESIRIGEDYSLLLEALACGGHCVVSPEPGYRYTVRRGSTSFRLTAEDVERILEEDRRLMSAYSFSPAAKRAQRRRAANLREAYQYNRLVETIKAKQWGGAIRLALQHPAAARHLWMPIAKRLVGIFRH